MQMTLHLSLSVFLLLMLICSY
uniref:Uncharacterized protein n=1 Tax=Anguilla anguilla TaxID=7936 RepID=A0A0E9S8N8_ANGAN